MRTPDLKARIGGHLRRHGYALAALFVALGGTAVAVQKAPKNSVVSKSIKNGQVKAPDVKASQVQVRVGASCSPGAAIRSIAQDGTVQCDQGTPNGPAGGALAGAYPAPTIAAGAIGSPEIANGSIANEDLGFAQLGLTGAGAGIYLGPAAGPPDARVFRSDAGTVTVGSDLLVAGTTPPAGGPLQLHRSGFIRLPETTVPLEESESAKLYLRELPTGEERLEIIWDDGDMTAIATEP